MAGVTTQQPTGVDVEGMTVGISTEEDETPLGKHSRPFQKLQCSPGVASPWKGSDIWS